MGSVCVFVCGRCRTKYDSADISWFTNKHGELCHLCGDGVVGGAVEMPIEEVEKLSPLRFDSIDLNSQCPICGGLLTSGGADILKHHANGQLIDPNHIAEPADVFFQMCPTCLIARRMNQDAHGGWFLLEIESHWPKDADTVEQRIIFHFEWIKSITGFEIAPTEISKVLGFTNDTLEHIDGRSRKQINIPCGSCGKNISVAQHGTGPVRLAARDSLRIAGFEATILFVCGFCGRVDYYLHNVSRNKWTWCYTTAPLDAGWYQKQLAEQGFNMASLTEQERKRLMDERPVIEAQKMPAASEEKDEISELAKQIKKAMQQ